MGWGEPLRPSSSRDFIGKQGEKELNKLTPICRKLEAARPPKAAELDPVVVALGRRRHQSNTVTGYIVSGAP